MNEIETLLEQMIAKIMSTNEYTQYYELLQRVKSNNEVYARIGDYRRRSLWVQMQEGEDFIHGNSELQKDFADLQENGLVNEFFAAEHQYVAMIRKIQDHFLEGISLDTTFLDG
ncbi:MAG: YlbF family regulator [Lachnospiraceae bacterium]|nr:YlbF family regulator [Lachnospiraceae bacterium]